MYLRHFIFSVLAVALLLLLLALALALQPNSDVLSVLYILLNLSSEYSKIMKALLTI